MGCTVSRHDSILSTNTTKQPTRPSSPITPPAAPPTPQAAVSFPTPLVHHPPLKKGDTYHLVSLTSTSYGSLVLIRTRSKHLPTSSLSSSPSSSSPDSVINTWELMEGLEDKDIIRRASQTSPAETAAKELTTQANSTKPLWQHLSEELLLGEMDPNVGSSFRQAMWSSTSRQQQQQQQLSTGLDNNFNSGTYKFVEPPTKDEDKEEDQKIVIYYTSLRGIQRTYRDCCAVRTIFKGFRVPVDERDVSMDSSYRKALENALDRVSDKKKKAITRTTSMVVSLPQVFIRGKYVGGAEEIKQLHEVGELAKLLQGLPVLDPGDVFVCQTCGDARFLPCCNCNGSKKVFDEEQGEAARCPHCNENGLIRCPHCCL